VSDAARDVRRCVAALPLCMVATPSMALPRKASIPALHPAARPRGAARVSQRPVAQQNGSGPGWEGAVGAVWPPGLARGCTVEPCLLGRCQYWRCSGVPRAPRRAASAAPLLRGARQPPLGRGRRRFPPQALLRVRRPALRRSASGKRPSKTHPRTACAPAAPRGAAGLHCVSGLGLQGQAIVPSYAMRACVRRRAGDDEPRACCAGSCSLKAPACTGSEARWVQGP
jgi:hypothetical protein